MSAADQQSLNAVKAALQNARTRDAAGSTFAAPGEQPFVCAKVGLRINDLAAVISLAERVDAGDDFTAKRVVSELEKHGLVSGADFDKVAAQRDELLDGVEKLTDTCNALTDRVKELESERNDITAIEEQCQRMIDRATGEDPRTTSIETLDTRLAFLIAEFVAERNNLAALQEALATEKAAHLASIAERDALKGIQPELPPFPPAGSGLPRYGLRWNGPTTPLAVPMDDGYWTPAHLALALVPTDEQMIINRKDYERLIASLPAGPRAVR